MTTPLLMSFIKQALDDRGGLTGADRRLFSQAADCHCFELSEVWNAVTEMAHDIEVGVYDVGFEQTFLPAPRTWIECRWHGCRYGFMLEEGADGIRYTCVIKGLPEYLKSFGKDEGYDLDKYDDEIIVSEGRALVPRLSLVSSLSIERTNGADSFDVFQIYVALSLINTPKIIGRRQHMPHRALEKRLLKERKNIGKFPLHAWTEITLRITPPKDLSGVDSCEAHLTGQKALHFCRAHLRVRCGRVEIVRGHWRGDPSLGVKRSRYRVTT
ncbi:hypothetical protein KYK30_31865 [Shinella yambaruensis]|uniref:Uncharacterized protein n=1 Tax=Shinella yambaruensis TaxID=415996 RepID=A0ABQ5ZVN8_9HYPH|nr:hypothetical protein [Shinella yambaruensis]MCJ8030031.1 hypothetical protein [Shinella yambaruensis]MCU7984323.1 hypothetical protein [Shinella yambaruensis]GLR55151.1 hypothetical protein GCM10007923_63720 [Shinella yambaruensis]